MVGFWRTGHSNELHLNVALLAWDGASGSEKLTAGGRSDGGWIEGMETVRLEIVGEGGTVHRWSVGSGNSSFSSVIWLPR